MNLPFDDRGFTLGDGLFETVLVEDGAPVWWDEHLDRLERGCAALGLPRPDRQAVRSACDAAMANLANDRAALRISWTAGSGGRGLDRPRLPEPRLAVIAAPAPTPEGPATLITASIRRNEASPASRHKTLSYLDNVLARREAAAAGAEEALMLNTRGEIACAAAANLFWVKGGLLHTPALDCGVLDGIARAKVMAASPLPVREVRAGLEALEGADSVFLTSSLIGVRAACRLDGRQLQPLQVILAERLGLM